MTSMTSTTSTTSMMGTTMTSSTISACSGTKASVSTLPCGKAYPTIISPAGNEEYRFQGCYNDTDPSGSALALYYPLGDGTATTREKCVAICAQHNYAYAGLEDVSVPTIISELQADFRRGLNASVEIPWVMALIFSLDHIVAVRAAEIRQNGAADQVRCMCKFWADVIIDTLRTFANSQLKIYEPNAVRINYLSIITGIS